MEQFFCDVNTTFLPKMATEGVPQFGKYCTISINSSVMYHRATWQNEIWPLSQITRPLDKRVVCHSDLDKVVFTEIWVFSVTEQFWFLWCTTTLNLTHNTAEMARQKAAPDKILPMSQASRWSDEKKILLSMLQSQRGDELIEIVQYAHKFY